MAHSCFGSYLSIESLLSSDDLLISTLQNSAENLEPPLPVVFSRGFDITFPDLEQVSLSVKRQDLNFKRDREGSEWLRPCHQGNWVSVRDEKQASHSGIVGVARIPPAPIAVARPMRAPFLYARLEVIEGTSSHPRTVEYCALEF